MRLWYDPLMRTTIFVEDRLGEAAKTRAREEGVSLSAFVSRSLELQLARSQAAPVAALPFRLVTVGGDGPRPGIDLDRTSELLAADDEVAFRPGEGR